jgi:hypothetical protein
MVWVVIPTRRVLSDDGGGVSERDKPSSETGGRQPRGLGGDSGSEDWRRYGSANPGTAGPRARAESGLGETDEAGHPPDDQYHAYRLEGSRSGSRTAAELALAGRHRRTSNLIGVGAAVAVIAAAALAFNIQASTISPPPAASRAALRSLSSSSSTIPSATSPGPFKSTLIGQVSVTIRLPLSVTIPDRGLDPDNGIAMYLTGPPAARVRRSGVRSRHAARGSRFHTLGLGLAGPGRPMRAELLGAGGHVPD